MVKFILVFLILFANGPMDAVAQNKVVILPFDDARGGTDLMPLVIPAPEVPEEPPVASPYLVDAIDKPVVWNQGWDNGIGYNTVIDTSVQISYNGFSSLPCCGPAIAWTPNASIRHWGRETTINSQTHAIYAKAVLLIDRGATVEGGAFEWVIDNQNLVIIHNLHISGPNQAWVEKWNRDQPRSGQTVWFFLMSDDRRYSSNPVSFIWP
jgi:hypothetical protein